MSRTMREEFEDYEIGLVNSYIRGDYKRHQNSRRDEMNIRACLEMLVERACHIRPSGIELGGLDFGTYRREKRRRQQGRNEFGKRILPLPRLDEEPTPGATSTPGGTCREVNSRRS